MTAQKDHMDINERYYVVKEFDGAKPTPKSVWRLRLYRRDTIVRNMPARDVCLGEVKKMTTWRGEGFAIYVWGWSWFSMSTSAVLRAYVPTEAEADQLLINIGSFLP